jgi:diadenosine tetraphosphatase ApaH/serine/threonine PP2A family protein phosphatase
VDRLVVEGADEHGQDWSAAREQLGEARLKRVASWPLTVELDVDGIGRTVFCHAIPRADEPVFTRITPDDVVLHLVGEVSAELLVCGHTHVQFDRRLSNGLRVVNSGSVGMPYEGRRGAFWARLGPEVELRRTDYDVEGAVATIRAAPGFDDERHVGYLLEPPDPDETTAFFEQQRGA